MLETCRFTSNLSVARMYAVSTCLVVESLPTQAKLLNTSSLQLMVITEMGAVCKYAVLLCNQPCTPGQLGLLLTAGWETSTIQGVVAVLFDREGNRRSGVVLSTPSHSVAYPRTGSVA